MKYDADSIDVNIGLEAVRNAPQIYLGNPDSRGMFQCVKEPIDNGIDEAVLAISNGAKQQYVGISVQDKNIWVYDQGRGIPIEIHKKTKISTLTTILTTLSAGGKMRKGKDSSYNKGVVGVHGMGVSITNAMSEQFVVWTCRDKIWYRQEFKKGKPTTKVSKTVSPTVPFAPKDLAKRKNGTVVSFKFDQGIFDKGSKLETKDLEQFLDLTAYLHPKIKFYFSTEKNSKEFSHPKGLEEYTTKLLKDKKAEAQGKCFVFTNSEIDVALQWSSYDDDGLNSFVNGSATAEHGTHVNGINKAIGLALESFKPKRGKNNYKAEDLRIGMLGALNYKLQQPRFTTQTKTKLATPEALDNVCKPLTQALKTYFSNNKSVAKMIIDRAIAVREAFEEFKLNKKAAAELKTTKNGKSKLPSNYADCTINDAKKREIFIVEGESAGGTAKKARIKEFQAILPLKGKPINAYKAKADKLFMNTEIRQILQVIGYDPSKKDPFENLRASRIIFLADADPDGAHVDLLLSAVFHKMLRPMFDKQMIYTVDAPLFTTQIGTKRYHGSSIKEVKDQLTPSQQKKVNITRIKGWGECSPEVLAEAAFNTKTRRLNLLMPVKGKKMNEYISVMGAETDFRKTLLGVV